MQVNFTKIKTVAPKAWADFDVFFKINFPDFVSKTEFTIEKLPFEMLLGILLRYFIENGVEWDVSNTEYNMLPETLTEVFENYEKTISHYS